MEPKVEETDNSDDTKQGLVSTPEFDYKSRSYSPYKSQPFDLCGNCVSYYQDLFDKGITESPFPPDCQKHILNRLDGIQPEDFSTPEEYENATYLLDPITWAKVEFGWEPRWYQEMMLSCTSTKKLYRCGRRLGKCNKFDTPVMTPQGPVEIQHLKKGDTVFDENGNPIKVLEVFDQGIQDVVDLSNNGQVMATCTLNHPWQTKHNRIKGTKVRKVKEFYKGTKICRQELSLSLGNVHEPHAYVLGALLGDGCSRSSGLVISNNDEPVVAKIAKILNTTYKRNSCNYSWHIHSLDINKSIKPSIHNYSDWIHNRYAHEKIVDLEIIKTWNRESLLQFVAGLLDSDGSVSFSGKEICINLSMQAKSVLNAFKYAVLALWQLNPTIGVDNRKKYKNGPVYYISIKHIYHCKRILKELDEYLQCNRKKYKIEYDALISNNFDPSAIGVTLSNPRQEHCYDIHVDSPTNLYLLANGLVTHNTEALVIETAYEICTSSEITVLMVAPYERQVTRFFDELTKFLKRSASYSTSISRYIRNPSRLELQNGSKILGFSSAATGSSRSDKIRGQDAHLIIIDEMDYLLSHDIDAIIAILASRPDCKLIAASTPVGWRKKFYQFCSDKNLGFKEFWFISAESPVWTPKLQGFFAKQSGGEKSATYIHEYLADFAEASEGVFKSEHINSSIENYATSDIERLQGAQYIMGVDWNKSAGTHIVIIEWADGKLRLVKKVIIPEQEYTQTAAVHRIISLNRIWNFKYIFVDAGYGSTQTEMLKQYALKDRVSGFDKKLYSIHMNQHLEITDPTTGNKEKKPAKPFLVQQTAKLLEDGMLILPQEEDTAVATESKAMGLIQQMRNYIVEGYSILGLPRYSQGQDHTLTAYMLACGGFAWLEGDLKKVPYATRVGGVKLLQTVPNLSSAESSKPSSSVKEVMEDIKKGLTLKSTTRKDKYQEANTDLTRDLDANKTIFGRKSIRKPYRPDTRSGFNRKNV